MTKDSTPICECGHVEDGHGENEVTGGYCVGDSANRDCSCTGYSPVSKPTTRLERARAFIRVQSSTSLLTDSTPISEVLADFADREVSGVIDEFVRRLFTRGLCYSEIEAIAAEMKEENHGNKRADV